MNAAVIGILSVGQHLLTGRLANDKGEYLYYPPPPVAYFPPPAVFYAPTVAVFPRPFYAPPPTVVFRAGGFSGSPGHWSHGDRGHWGHGHGGRRWH